MRNHKKHQHNKTKVLSHHQSENIDVNKMCSMIPSYDKLPSNEIYALDNVRRIRQRQEKNILCQMNINNLQLQFYSRFNKEIDRKIPVWNQMQQIQNLSNEEAVEQFRYYQSIKAAQPDFEEEENLIIGKSRENAGMFQDNMGQIYFKGEQMQDDYESILELTEKEDVDEPHKNFYFQ